MSNQDDRNKHSRRIQNEDNAIRKQLKIAKDMGMTRYSKEESHRLAKHHALDCGVPRCPICSSARKLFGEPTIQERSFYQTKFTGETGED